jgi:hypothetical protein
MCGHTCGVLDPPSLRDCVPDGHLVWTGLDAVAELDLSAVCSDYHDDGRGRAAYEPSMMVALLLTSTTPLVRMSVRTSLISSSSTIGSVMRSRTATHRSSELVGAT